jgi:hypothetical protein
VEEGVPFCLHCRAPQIRVVIATPVPSPAAAAAVTVAGQDSASQTALGLPVQWSQSVTSCALPAFIAAVVIVLQLMSLLVAVPGAGLVAVALHLRRNPGSSIGGRVGARLGALCGFFCFGMTAALAAVRVAVLREGEEIRRSMLDAIQRTAILYPGPQFQPGLDFMRSPAGLVFMMVFMLIFMFLFFLILGSLGGALGGATLGRRGRN